MPKGLIEIATPNGEGFDFKILKENTAKLRNKNEFIHYLLYETNSDVVQSFQKFLQENLLSSHMLIFAEKV